jgi:hypothetical protein
VTGGGALDALATGSAAIGSSGQAGAISILVLGGLVVLPVLLATRAARPANPGHHRRPRVGHDALAMTGDFISAAGFLGLTGLVALSGADALLCI